ncbi:MAG: hypothetical protein CEN91_544 [Candidatus Berkelbacteria bacterium Licking1014_85]|uniref:Uncharacterized protein n=1 Tax=Candidatus Berkelbacteria bacterium Licking1014_85 TaxID=2017148 RepID=A0A554LH34_9BACT|nr:MAG: hypothetical protein CEN91_544 [Candidatus Berkelbacteria bacterium Licking1014_85]
MIYILIIFGGFFRLIPHLPNFTPINAIGLFGGRYLDKKTSIISIILIMFMSDWIIGFYNWKLMLVVYFSLIFSAIIGQHLQNKNNIFKLLCAIFLSSGFFFFATNLGVWLFTNMYSHNLAGLLNCYIMGLPFYKNMLMGDLVYTFGLFGIYEIIKQGVRYERKHRTFGFLR